MRIVHGYPPNIEEIRAGGLNPRPTTIFAYGDAIYSPAGASGLPDHLIVHERTHSEQQRAAGGPAEWWRRYIADPEFRLEQEVAAYRAQLRAAHALPRHERRRLLARTSRDLASPMYGGIVTAAKARALLAS